MSSYEKHDRHSIRIRGYDYSHTGMYFVTLCVKGGEHLLGEIIDGVAVLSEIGEIAERCWIEIPQHFPYVRLNEYVFMPNHAHGVIEIVGAENYVGVENLQPLRVNRYQQAIPRSLSSIIRGFKIGVTKCCNQHGHNHFAWQRNYYEHVVRNESELNRICEYIMNNSQQWQFDRENPDRIRDKTYDKEWGHFEDKMFGKSK